MNNIVLIHGGFVDGSGWEGVYRTLKKDGYNVSIVQNPTLSLADDVAVTKRTLASQDGPVILVGHSYQRSAARRTRTTDTASARRLFVPRPGEVPRFLRSRCGSRKSRFHG